MKINGFGASQDSTDFYGTRWYQTESRKRENIKKCFQTLSDTSETYVSEGKKSTRQSGVDYLRRPA